MFEGTVPATPPCPGLPTMRVSQLDALARHEVYSGQSSKRVPVAQPPSVACTWSVRRMNVSMGSVGRRPLYALGASGGSVAWVGRNNSDRFFHHSATSVEKSFRPLIPTVLFY